MSVMPTIIEQIRASLPHINPSNSIEEFYVGNIFQNVPNSSTAQDFTNLVNTMLNNAVANPKVSWLAGILELHYLGSYQGYEVAPAIQAVLDMMPAVNYVPGTSWEQNIPTPDYLWTMHHSFAAIIYMYADLLNYQTAKWDKTQAYNEFKANSFWNVGGVLECSHIGGFAIPYGPRGYDETLETARTFMEFYLHYGITDALNCAKTLVDFLVANLYINGIFMYALGWHGIEVETPGIWMLLMKYDALSGYSYPNLATMLDSDVWEKALAQGWSSPIWYNESCCTNHLQSYHWPRIDGTLKIGMGFHAIWGYLSDRSKTAIRNMMMGTGVTRWFNCFLSNGLFDPATNMFRYCGPCTDASGSGNPTPSPDGPSTAQGLLAMLVMGIIPNTSYILMPLINEFSYESIYMFRPDAFICDVTNNKLRLIVTAGVMNFQFGSNAPVSATFSKAGVYDIQFDADWNNVLYVTFIQDPPSDIYPGTGTPAPPCESYTDEPTCKANGCYWYDGACHTALVCENLTNQTDCVNNNCYWWTDGTCHANAESPYDLTVSVNDANLGTTSPLPGIHTYPKGTQVTCTATATTGVFSHWTKDGNTVSGNPITVLMDATHSVEAIFTAGPPPPQHATVAGTVTSFKGPVVGATVTLDGYDAVTGADGSFSIENVPFATYTLTVQPGSFLDKLLLQSASLDVAVSQAKTYQESINLPVNIVSVGAIGAGVAGTVAVIATALRSTPKYGY